MAAQEEGQQGQAYRDVDLPNGSTEKEVRMNPLLIPEIPKEVFDAAILLDEWFTKQNIATWELINVCSRNHAHDLKELREEIKESARERDLNT